MNTKPRNNLGTNVDLLASALVQSAPQTARARAGSIVATRPGESQDAAQRRAAAVRAKQR